MNITRTLIIGLILSALVTGAGHIQAAGNSVTGSPPAGGSVTGTPPDTSGGGSLTNPLNSINSLPELLTAILKGVVEIGAIFLTLMIVYVGFLFVAAEAC
jgi:hypothetical protein